MNKRIKELARQAYIEARLDENPKWRESFVSEAAMNEIQSTMEKFAELVVRECADLFEVEYGQSEVSGNEVAEVVKKHFGVEEPKEQSDSDRILSTIRTRGLKNDGR